MAMSEGYRNAIANAGADLIKYIGLVDHLGTELSGGDYERLAVYWSSASGGIIRPWANEELNQDLEFDVPAGKVKGWRGYSAKTGGTDYGGEALTEETFAAAGKYRLLGASTGVKHLDAV